jgi:hypothetical protein
MFFLLQGTIVQMTKPAKTLQKMEKQVTTIVNLQANQTLRTKMIKMMKLKNKLKITMKNPTRWANNNLKSRVKSS